jgi:type II secretory ATPase GspE/PulE/Tfp pilus assembly ATPase PilB-like protein
MVRVSPAGRTAARNDTPEVLYPDLLHSLLWNAIIEKATDVHLHCVPDGVRVLHRVDGIIHPKLRLSPGDGRRLLNQLKSAAGLTVVRAYAPLEGQIVWPDEDRKWEIRVTFTPVGDQVSAHLRFLSARRDEWDLPNLGLLHTDQERISTSIRSLNGLVLVTGATGSGKTTTMYSLASLMDLQTTTAYSIEDPVEFRLPYAQQIEVDEVHGLTMHEGLRTILRMDPDLILVGEIRDPDSAIVAARAALSGRLVLATIHAQDAAGAVDALHYLGVPHHIIGSSLRLVIAQNLVRCLCPSCSLPREPDEAEKDLFARFSLEPPESLPQTTGCGECNWYGYRGRTGIFEVAVMDDELAELISTGASHRDLSNELRRKGIHSMTRNGLEKAALGMTSLEELERVCGATRSGAPTRPAPEPLAVDAISR